MYTGTKNCNNRIVSLFLVEVTLDIYTSETFFISDSYMSYGLRYDRR